MRPFQLAVLLLASGDLLPRQRARDQQADLAGGQLKQRILQRLVELDPDLDQLTGALDQIVGEIGEPVGPTRAVARQVAEELVEMKRNPRLMAWLIDQARESAR